LKEEAELQEFRVVPALVPIVNMKLEGIEVLFLQKQKQKLVLPSKLIVLIVRSDVLAVPFNNPSWPSSSVGRLSTQETR